MNPLSLADGTIINLTYVRVLIPYLDGSYRIVWSDSTILDLSNADATIMTNYLAAHAITPKPTLNRPPAPRLA